MATIGSITIGMAVNTAGLDAGLGRAAGSVTLFGSRLENSAAATMRSSDRIKAFGLNAADLAGGLEGHAVPKLGLMSTALSKVGLTSEAAMGALKGAAAGAAAAIATAAAGVLYHAFNSLKAADDTMDLADRLGTTAGALAELRYVAQLSGTDIGSMDLAIGKLSANLGDAAARSTPAGVALERIGLSARDLAVMDPADALKLIIENFGRLPTKADQAAAAMDIFGKSGLGILGTLRLGSSGLAKLTAETGGLKAAFAGVNGEQIGAANDAMDRLSFAWGAFGTVLAAKIAPIVTDITTTMTGWLTSASAEGSAVGNTFKLIADAIGLIGSAAKTAMPVASMLGAAWAWVVHEEAIVRVDRNGAPIKAAAKAAPEKAPADAAVDTELIAAVAKGRDLEKTLQDQIGAFGMSADAAQVYKLALAGIPDELLASIGAMVEQKQEMELQKQTWDLMKSDAKSFYEAALTPGEKLIEQQTKLNMLLDAGLISRETFDANMKKDLTEKANSVIDDTRTPLEQYEKKLGELENMLTSGAIDRDTFGRAVGMEQDKLGMNDPAQLAGVAEMGSSAAYSAIAKFETGGQGKGIDLVAKNTTDTLAVLRAQLEEMKKAKGGVPAYEMS